MARREEFVAGGLRITTWRDFNGRAFVCWRPDVSIFCQTNKEVLRFAAWPVKTPTGDALREWLASLGAADQQKGASVAPVGDAQVEGSFDPLAHQDEDPTAATRMIT
ncbi:MAG: hypothetical protein LW834_21700 [Cyanobium sp. 49614_E6]|nr:hypothetical protein [Cyanobium sp. 49614_E6]